MRTSQGENKFVHPFRSVAAELSRKALSAKDLKTQLEVSPTEKRRETLVTHFLTTTYNLKNAVSPLSHPATFAPFLSHFCWVFFHYFAGLKSAMITPYNGQDNPCL